MSGDKIYNFSLPTKLVMGCGSLQNLAQETQLLGKKVLLVTGRRAMRKLGILDQVEKMLRDAGLTVIVFDQVEPEPGTETVNQAVELAKKENCQVVIGLGGGSVLDIAKAIAGIANKVGKVEIFMAGKKLDAPGLPFIAIPTTSGSGAEVTPNAVLINRKTGVKKSFRDPLLAAKVAIIDPQLTINLSPQLTAYSGMDALCQAIESLVSLGANPLTDSLSRGAIQLLGRSLLKAYKQGKDLSARTEMSYGALLAGIALINARMGVVHGIAHPLGVRYGLAHGLVCGLLLPYAMEFNLVVRQAHHPSNTFDYAQYSTLSGIEGSNHPERSRRNAVADKYAEIAPFLGGELTAKDKTEEAAKEAISRVRNLLTELDFPKGLAELGVKEKDFAAIAKDSLPSGSLKANPKKVGARDVIEILRKAM